ncbi:MAG: hypothetical protein JWM11_2202 [Planctomycetaceae bacterium]|nr:hypothetical protein [Planctomycetaceae bacterium]
MRFVARPDSYRAVASAPSTSTAVRCRAQAVCALLLLCCGIGLTGCGPGGPVIVPVRGTVEYKGATLSNGTITFSPKDPTEGHVAQSPIAEDGTFALSTFKTGDGAIVGTYLVSVVSTIEGTEVLEKDKGTGIGGKTAIPIYYQDPKTSGLTETIEASGSPELTIELKDK